MNGEIEKVRPYWFVGASFEKGTKDQSERFISDGIWENGYEDKYIEIVNSIQPGDKIAIKSVYTQKYELPFGFKGKRAAVMAIKAIGKVTENQRDGRNIRVNWQKIDPPRIWYFSTRWDTISAVYPGNWKSNALIDFTFNGKPQDISRFLVDQSPQIKSIKSAISAFFEKFPGGFEDSAYIGDMKSGERAYKIHAHDAYVGQLGNGIAEKLLTDNSIKEISGRVVDVISKGKMISAFEWMAVRTCFTGKESEKRFYEKMFAMIEYGKPEKERFEDCVNALKEVPVPKDTTTVMKWPIFTMLPHLAKPEAFMFLKPEVTKSSLSAMAIEFKYSPQLCWDTYNSLMEAADLLMDELRPLGARDYIDIQSFIWIIYNMLDANSLLPPEDPHVVKAAIDERPYQIEDIVAVNEKPYQIDDIINDGCFVEREEIDDMLARLSEKKNLILQGPPGTGKTWLAKRLAYALIGKKDKSKIRAMQFHPNLSYEDFVQGWRPGKEKHLALVDGPFMKAVNNALENGQEKYVVVIEEINRGNPAQIFGEMLTLLEADKRNQEEALELCYGSEDAKCVYIPGNLYVIGTMNLADRSLALVDLALRRRFAFAELEPRIEKWREWILKKFVVDPGAIKEIEDRVLTLNREISEDGKLGKQFRIGHSYLVPADGTEIKDTGKWFKRIVESEIRPLLEEYWFDDPTKVRDATQNLVKGFN